MITMVTTRKTRPNRRGSAADTSSLDNGHESAVNPGTIPDVVLVLVLFAKEELSDNVTVSLTFCRTWGFRVDGVLVVVVDFFAVVVVCLLVVVVLVVVVVGVIVEVVGVTV